MALANYFSKDLLAINRLIDTDQSVLEDTLNSKIITLGFDENAANTFEGSCGLDLTVRLLSRLYPKLKIIDLSDKNEEKRTQLISLSKEINSKIEIISDELNEDIYIVAGYTKKDVQSEGVKIFFGSNNWNSKYSASSAQSFENSNNPIGCGISSCIVASNVFRHIFNSVLEFGPDKEFELSTFTLDTDTKNNPSFGAVDFKDVTIAGAGAIGNGVIWTLSKIENLKGNIALVDSETVSLSNLQRYVLFKEKDEKRVKVDVAKEFFTQKELKIEVCYGKWDDYVDKREDWNINCVAVGIDNEKDRIGIQGSLPKIIFNSFTETELIGITRHTDFRKYACLACSYIPNGEKKNRIAEISENCNIPDKVEMIKDYYNLNKPVDENFLPKYPESLLYEIAKATKADISEFSQFNGMTVDEFYQDFICGGKILKLLNTENEIKNVDAPLAFQSAMAGILLAAELVKHFLNIDLQQELRTDFYHLSPIDSINPYHRKLEKDLTGRCLCRDDDFLKRYNKKWYSK